MYVSDDSGADEEEERVSENHVGGQVDVAGVSEEDSDEDQAPLDRAPSSILSHEQHRATSTGSTNKKFQVFIGIGFLLIYQSVLIFSSLFRNRPFSLRARGTKKHKRPLFTFTFLLFSTIFIKFK